MPLEWGVMVAAALGTMALLYGLGLLLGTVIGRVAWWRGWMDDE